MPAITPPLALVCVDSRTTMLLFVASMLLLSYAWAAEYCPGEVAVYNGLVNFRDRKVNRIGTTREIICLPGYVSLGSPVATCISTGWSVMGTCITRSLFRCPNSEDIIASTAFFTEPEWADDKWAMKRSFSCLPGYSLRGTSYYECLETAARPQWVARGFCEISLKDNAQVEGARMLCPDAELRAMLKNAIFAGDSTPTPAGYFVRPFQCLPGYFPIGSAQIAVCNPNEPRPGYSGWKFLGTCEMRIAVIPLCEEPTVEYGTVAPGSNSFGTTRSFSCFDGIPLVGTNTLICTMNGTWFSSGICIPSLQQMAEFLRKKPAVSVIPPRRVRTTAIPTTSAPETTSRLTTQRVIRVATRIVTRKVVTRIITRKVPVQTTARVLPVLPSFASNCRCEGRKNNPDMVAAARTGNVAHLRFFLSQGASYDSVDSRKQRAFLAAIENGGSDVMQVFLECIECVDIDLGDEGGATPLMYLARSNRTLSYMDRLIRDDADIDARSRNGSTALHVAATFGCYIPMRLLLSSGANPNAVDRERNTPLIRAVQGQFIDAVKVLLNSKADVNISNLRGETPLLIAAKKGFREILLLLLSQPKILFDAYDIDGYSAEEYAAIGGWKDMSDLIKAKRLSLYPKKAISHRDVIKIAP